MHYPHEKLGIRSQIVEHALVAYMQSVENGLTHTHKGRRLDEEVKEMKQYISNTYKVQIQPTNQYIQKHLNEAITAVFGISDRRSIRNKCQKLKAAGHLKEISPVLFELT